MSDVFADALGESDKFFWHRYGKFYEAGLAGIDCRRVVEIGVFRGASIRWLLQRYPKAEVVGVDIVPATPEWPESGRVRYVRLDQSDRRAIRELFDSFNAAIDLVIDDGSHLPRHQAGCLVEGVRALRSEGAYVVEDIHTSLPRHPQFRRMRPWFRRVAGPLHVLLAIEHHRAIGTPSNGSEYLAHCVGDLFSRDDLRLLDERIQSVSIYRRSVLPLRCYGCGGSDYDYVLLRCRCGVDLYADTDSMSALVRCR